MSRLDLTFPPAENQKGLGRPADGLRVYESSSPGLVTVHLRSDHSHGLAFRLDREQVEDLVDGLIDYLDPPPVEEFVKFLVSTGQVEDHPGSGSAA